MHIWKLLKKEQDMFSSVKRCKFKFSVKDKLNKPVKSTISLITFYQLHHRGYLQAKDFYSLGQEDQCEFASALLYTKLYNKYSCNSYYKFVSNPEVNSWSTRNELCLEMFANTKLN